MYYALVFYPQEETEPIARIRRKYDPMVDVIRPHVTVLFRVPDTLGEAQLVSHIEKVLRDCKPFVIRLGGFHKSRDHWLYLTLSEGGPTVKELYRALYTGILAEYRRDDIEFVPHLSLGLFVKEGPSYDWENPQESEFDEERYKAALRQAEALPLRSSFVVETLYLVKVPNDVIEWKGQMASCPKNSRVIEVRGFQLVDEGA